MPLCPTPKKPKQTELLDAHSILSRAIDSAESFFSAFNQVRSARSAKGTPTDHEQDLLRAALLFAAAGLDSMVKQLIRDALPNVIENDEGARQQFSDYVQTKINKNNSFDTKLITFALLSDHPKFYFRSELIKELTGSSLQSKDQILRAAAYFAIPADEITSHPNKLKIVFDSRNQIAHEMDVLLGQINRSRRSRAFNTMHDYTTYILKISIAFYVAVEKRI